jgi:hypothetical protein
MRSVADERDVIQHVLLMCGVLAPLFQMATDQLAGRLLQGYSFAAQSMSELSASGAPTRRLVVALTIVATVLMAAFGVGVWRASGQALLPRVVAGLVIGNAVLGLIATALFPTRFGERPAFGSAGVILMFLSVVCFVLAMVVGAVAYSGWLRIVSAGIPAAYVLLSVLRLASAGSASTGGTTELMGIQERTMGYAFLLWVLALAVHLLLSSIAVDSAGSVGG